MGSNWMTLCPGSNLYSRCKYLPSQAIHSVSPVALGSWSTFPDSLIRSTGTYWAHPIILWLILRSSIGWASYSVRKETPYFVLHPYLDSSQGLCKTCLGSIFQRRTWFLRRLMIMEAWVTHGVTGSIWTWPRSSGFNLCSAITPLSNYSF